MLPNAALTLFYKEFIWLKVSNSVTVPGYLCDKQESHLVRGVAVNRLNFPPNADQACDKFHLHFTLAPLQVPTQRSSEEPQDHSLSLMPHSAPTLPGSDTVSARELFAAS